MADQNFRVKRGLEVGVGATVLTTTATGNIGIGSTNPQERLDVQGGNGFIRIGEVFSGYNGIALHNSTADSDYNLLSSAGDSNLYINRKSTGGIYFRIANSDQMVLSSGGNLGILSTSPTSRLDVIGDAKVSGVVTATTFSGNATTATFATNAGIATNLKGGLVGNIPYQSAADTTVFLANGSVGSILQSNGVGNAPSWVPGAPSNAITGLTIRDEGTIVGSANSITQLNFVGPIVSAAATAGIATITFTFADFVSTAGFATVAGISTNVIGGIASVTQLNVSGIATIGVATIAAVTAQNLYVAGIATIPSLTGTTASFGTINVTTGNIVTGVITNAQGNNLNYSGVSTITNLVGTNINYTGVVTATTFSGTLLGYASTSGIATNLKGGSGGTIVYQSAADTTAFLANGSSGQVLQSNGGTNPPSWVNTAPANAITGLTIRDEGTIVSTANSFSQLDFVGNIVSVAGTGPSGIATITFADFVSTSGTSTSVIGGIASVSQLNVSGVGTFLSSGLKIRNPANTFEYSITGGAITNNRTLNLPVITTTDTVATLGLSQTFTGSQTFAATLTANTSSTINLGGSASGTHNFGTNQTSGTLTFGGTSGTGTITFGRATTSQQTDIQAGASGVGTTKTINLGTGGLSGSFTQINIGPTAGVGTVVINSGTNLGIGSATPTSKLDVVGDAKFTGVVTATTFSGNATSATALQNARDFSITGNFVTATAISFNGTGNVALAATITPNSIGLGTYTSGDYVQAISGTANQITVTSGTGEGSTPTLSFPNQVTLPEDLTVTRDVQINRNLNVNGNITIGGSSATLFTSELKIFDPDIILGFRTDALGNDVSNDNTANHGGVAVASTEGTPLVQLFIAGIETNPATYKKIMWFKSGTFAGLGTDAWLSNYAVGIGSTQFPVGTRLAAGNVQFTQNDLAVVRNINASGITTSSRLTLNGANDAATGGGQIYLNGATGNRIDFNTNGSGAPTTFTRSAGTKIVVYPSLSLTNADYAIGYESFTLWNSVADNLSSFKWYVGTNNVLTLNGSGNLGINSTNPTTKLDVVGDGKFTGNLGIGTINPGTRLDVQGPVAIGTGTDYDNSFTTLLVRQRPANDGYASLGFYPANGNFVAKIDAVNSTNELQVWSNKNLSDGSRLNINMGTSEYISFSPRAVEAARIIQGGTVLIGSATSTGTASQRLQVTGGAYVSGSVGIGTANPARPLEVNGTARLADGAALEWGGTSAYISGTSASNALLFGTSSAERVRITSTGNVGIATNNPAATFQVKDALAFETTNTTTTNTNQVAVDTFATATFRSAKYQVQVTCPGQISTLGGITTGGRGYTAGTYNVTFTTSSGNGSAAQGTLVVSNGTVGQISVSAGGTGYVTGDVLTASGGSGLQVSVGSTDAVGAITALTLSSAGTGYTGYYNATTGTGTTSLSLLGGSGFNAVGLATIFDGVITSSTLLQQPTTGTGGTVFYSGSNYSTASVLSITRSDLTNTITTITGSVGVSTFTSLTAHGIGVSDVVRVSSTSNGLTAGTDYYVVSVPSTTTFTLGTSVGVGTTFTTGSSLSIGFFRNSAANGGQVAYTNAITGISTNFQASDLMVLQNGTTADFIEYATIANNDILGTFASDISGSNARLLFTPTYPNNNIKVARQAITV